MTEREKAERAAYDAELRARIASGEITPADAEVEMDFFLNGWDSVQNIYG